MKSVRVPDLSAGGYWMAVMGLSFMSGEELARVVRNSGGSGFGVEQTDLGNTRHKLDTHIDTQLDTNIAG